jgi:hypothetical protein
MERLHVHEVGTGFVAAKVRLEPAQLRGLESNMIPKDLVSRNRRVLDSGQQQAAVVSIHKLNFVCMGQPAALSRYRPIML